jgi:ketosteroid isomerase-like protein
MYKRVVREILRSTFAGLSRGRIAAVTDRLSPRAEHFFIGQHALSGMRRTPASIAQWYQRLLRLFPDICFVVHRIDVSGPPWRTLATIEWSETNTGTDGVRTENTGVNVVEIRWGKVRRVAIYTDTARLVQTLDRLAMAGNPEAHAPPIVDL